MEGSSTKKEITFGMSCIAVIFLIVFVTTNYHDNYEIPPAPEGQKFYSLSCFLNVYKIVYDFPSLPSYDCSIIYVPLDTFDTTIADAEMNYPTVEKITLVLLFLVSVSVFGITIIELLYNKLDWYVQPLANIVIRRYKFVVERNRLQTMTPHP